MLCQRLNFRQSKGVEFTWVLWTIAISSFVVRSMSCFLYIEPLNGRLARIKASLARSRLLIVDMALLQNASPDAMSLSSHLAIKGFGVDLCDLDRVTVTSFLSKSRIAFLNLSHQRRVGNNKSMTLPEIMQAFVPNVSLHTASWIHFSIQSLGNRDSRVN